MLQALEQFNIEEASDCGKVIILTKHGGFLSVQHLVRERHCAGRNELVIRIQLLISDSIKLIKYLRNLLVSQEFLSVVYYVEGTQEPIIDKETFHAVQELMLRREGNKWQRQTHIFTKMIVCGNCGHTFKRKIVNGRTYWTCANHNTNSDNCPIKAIPESDIQDAYIRLFNKLKCNADTILATPIRQLEDLIMKNQAGNRQLLTVRSDLIAARDRINQVTRLYESGILSAELYNGQKKEAEAQINRLRKMMTAAVDTDELADRADRLSDLMDTVVDGDIMYSFEESAFEMTVEKITAMSDTELKFRLIGGIEFTERL